VNYWEYQEKCYIRRLGIRLLMSKDRKYGLFVILTRDKDADDGSPVPIVPGSKEYNTIVLLNLGKTPIYGLPRVLSLVTAPIEPEQWKGNLSHDYVAAHVIGPLLKHLEHSLHSTL
jgi:hypothetical protein